MSPLCTRLEPSGLLCFRPDVHQDARGFFLESYHKDKYAKAGLETPFVQDNQSRSMRHTLRGLHAQLRFPQGKLVRVLHGEIYDVAVDIRKSSPTFGKWHGEHLSAQNFKQLYLPPGFAHGFCVLSETADVEYKCTEFYHPEDEITLLWNDPLLGIVWPVEKPILSSKDNAGLALAALRKLLRDPQPAKNDLRH